MFQQLVQLIIALLFTQSVAARGIRVIDPSNHVTTTIVRRSLETLTPEPLEDQTKQPLSKRFTSGPLAENILGYSYTGMASVSIKQACYDVIDKYWQALWDGSDFNDRNSCGSSDKVIKAYIWQTSLAMQSLVDAQKLADRDFKDKISSVYSIIMKHFNSKYNAFSVTTNADSDIYYDDNAQVATALIGAYEVTGNTEYLDTASKTVEFLMNGWNTQYGGVTWHMGQSYIASISTSESALAALRLYAYKKDARYVEFAEKCISWIKSRLWDSSNNFIFDGTDGNTVNHDEYTYQVGTVLAACVKLWKITNNNTYLQMSHELAAAGVNKNLKFYNTNVDVKYRYWTNELDFTQLLVNGLIEYIQNVDSNSAIIEEVIREARMVYDFARGDDGMYFYSVNPYTNSNNIFQRWGASTKITTGELLDKTYYCNENTSQAPLRYLISQGAAGIIYAQVAYSLSAYF